ncbi:Endonuclease/exonuclease/phosphatase [Coprinopsis sp. MPI-PUGE-AT-0042]|nr:Endonuclease/exonuclease/phosphatase [Coprinopsis sp. MPI-PUGE-AT-0042]
MTTGRVYQRILSSFNPSKRLWVPTSSRRVPKEVTPPVAQSSRLSLVTQNLDAFSSRPVSRTKLLLQSIIDESECPDIVFLQEVTSDVRTSILDNPKVREAFLVTDAEDQTSFEEVPFANMTLLSKRRFGFEPESPHEEGSIEPEQKFPFGSVSRVPLPSKYGRCALSVDIIPPSSSPARIYRLINVHLDSLGHTLPFRTEQVEILANLLREPGCDGGLIAGDFNAISPQDHGLLANSGLVDAWIALYGAEVPSGATWGVGDKQPDGLGPGRLDKVAMLNVEAENMEIVRPGRIEVPRPGGDSRYIRCSDHCGLKLTFTVRTQ